jgi:hypothetical protein
MTLDTATDAEQATAPAGLLDLAPATETPPAPPAGHPAANGNAAAETKPSFQGEAKPAPSKPTAQRPEGLPDQFWDAEKGEVRLAELIKSQADLRRIVSRGEHKPPPTPDDYKLPTGDTIPGDLIKPDDPLWKATTAAAHARGFSQADLEALAKPFLETLAELTKDARPLSPEQAKAAQEQALAAEMAKLGPQGQAMIRGVDTWLKGLAAKQVLTAEELTALRSVGTADGVRALAKLRELAGERSLGINAGVAPEIGSEEEARALLRQGFAAGGEQTDEGRALLEKGRDMLRRLEAAGVKLGTVRQPR